MKYTRVMKTPNAYSIIRNANTFANVPTDLAAMGSIARIQERVKRFHFRSLVSILFCVYFDVLEMYLFCYCVTFTRWNII